MGCDIALQYSEIGGLTRTVGRRPGGISDLELLLYATGEPSSGLGGTG